MTPVVDSCQRLFRLPGVMSCAIDNRWYPIGCSIGLCWEVANSLMVSSYVLEIEELHHSEKGYFKLPFGYERKRRSEWDELEELRTLSGTTFNNMIVCTFSQSSVIFKIFQLERGEATPDFLPAPSVNSCAVLEERSSLENDSLEKRMVVKNISYTTYVACYLIMGLEDKLSMSFLIWRASHIPISIQREFGSLCCNASKKAVQWANSWTPPPILCSSHYYNQTNQPDKKLCILNTEGLLYHNSTSAFLIAYDLRKACSMAKFYSRLLLLFELLKVLIHVLRCNTTWKR